MKMPFFNFYNRAQSENSEKGFMAAEWLMAVSFLLFPTLLLVLSLVQVPPRKGLAQDAANAGARAYVQTLDQYQAPFAARAAVADVIASGVGETPDLSDAANVQSYLNSKEIHVDFHLVSGDGYCAGAEIRVQVQVPMPASFNPFNPDPASSLFSIGELKSSSTERIDDYAELVDSSSGYSGVPNFYDNENGTCRDVP